MIFGDFADYWKLEPETTIQNNPPFREKQRPSARESRNSKEKYVEQPQKIDTLKQKSKEIKTFADAIGNVLVDGFHYLALFAIGGSIVWSAMFAFIGMVAKGQAAIEDILLLFIYLELGAMVGIYFKTNHMPVRFLIYVGVTALIRMLVVSHEPDRGILLISGAILLLAIATLVFRYGSSKLPSVKTSSDSAL